MKKLNPHTLERSRSFLHQHCRLLDQQRFDYLFGNGDAAGIVESLHSIQHADGGFGDGLEPDFLLPDSSPMATTTAFQIFDEIGRTPAEPLIEKGIRYFEQHYQDSRKGWYAVPATVNEYPHAPWWHYDTAMGGTEIDRSWGNPSAEILGYLYQYSDIIQHIDLDEVWGQALQHLRSIQEFRSEHEMYCYLRLYEKLPQEQAEAMQARLAEAIESLVVRDQSQWKNYVPQAIHFITTPHSPFYPQWEAEIERNLDYLLDTITDEGVWWPNWTWGQYEEAWEQSKKNWTGMFTIRNLKMLHAFDRMSC